MMKSEFIEKLEVINPNYREFTEQEYKNIELVYMYHPAIQEKDDIIDLYLRFGYETIEDMISRSEKIREIDNQIFLKRQELDDLIDKKKMLGKQL